MSADANKTVVPILTLKDVCIDFPIITASDHRSKGLTGMIYDADLEVFPDEMITTVGGSGFGKFITIHAALGLLPGNGEVAGGTVTFDGRDITHLTDREFVGIRGNGISLALQGPITSLNPMWTVGAQTKEALRVNSTTTSSEAYKKVIEPLE